MSKAKNDVSVKPPRTRPVAKTNPTTAAFAVSDELWAVLEPLIPEHVNTHRFGRGRPRVPDRQCANGIFYVLRTGCQWKALDKTGLCSGSTAHLRFQAWMAAGVFLQFWEAGLAQYDEVRGIAWAWLSMNGAMTKAPLGGEKNGTKPDGSRQA
jgi:putative transposase